MAKKFTFVEEPQSKPKKEDMVKVITAKSNGKQGYQYKEVMVRKSEVANYLKK